MQEVTIEVQRRESVGKGANRRLRAQDLVPAVVYGGDREPMAIQIPKKMLLTLFREGGHENRIFLLQLAGTGQSRHAMVRELQVDPLNNQIAHIDFQRVLMDQKVRVKVHIELEGIPHGVKSQSGLLDFVTREVEVECLPADIPQNLKIDVTEIQVGEHIEAKALKLPAGVVYLGEEDVVIASVGHAKAEAVEAAPVVAPVAAEPEVIKKGKPEEAKES
jgi:large subunit ribosomal protein L25